MSPFFASLLPAGELDVEICITTEWQYEDLFAILEYIYSGNLLCPLQRKKRLLQILKELQIFVPSEQDTPTVDDFVVVSCHEPGNSMAMYAWNVQASGEDNAGLHLETIGPDVIDIVEDSSTSRSSSPSSYGSLRSSPSFEAHFNTDSSHSPIMPEDVSPAASQHAIQMAIQNVMMDKPAPLTKQPTAKAPSVPKMYRRKQNLGQSSTHSPKPSPTVVQRAQTTPVQLSSASKPAAKTTSPAAHQVYNRRNNKPYSRPVPHHLNVVIQKGAHQAGGRNQSLVGNNPAFQIVQLGTDADCLLLVAPSDDGLALSSVPEKEAVTLKSPLFSFDTSLPEETRLPQAPAISLSRYHADTWCHGIYSPFELKIPIPYVEIGANEETHREDRRFGHWSLFRLPTFLVARPENVYPARKSALDFSSVLNRNVHTGLNVSVIKKVKTFNGKIHMTLGGSPKPPRAGLPSIFLYKDGSPSIDSQPKMILPHSPTELTPTTRERAAKLLGTPSSSKGSAFPPLLPEFDVDDDDDDDDILKVDTHQDLVDEALAKHYVQKEIRRKNNLQARIRMFTDNLNQ